MQDRYTHGYIRAVPRIIFHYADYVNVYIALQGTKHPWF
jgi:hypothetical protein